MTLKQIFTALVLALACTAQCFAADYAALRRQADASQAAVTSPSAACNRDSETFTMNSAKVRCIRHQPNSRLPRPCGQLRTSGRLLPDVAGHRPRRSHTLVCVCRRSRRLPLHLPPSGWKMVSHRPRDSRLLTTTDFTINRNLSPTYLCVATT